MADRPEILWPLFAGIEALDGVGPKTARAFEGLGIRVPKDMLLTLPHAVIDRRLRPSLQGLVLPATVTVEVSVLAHQPPAARGRPARVRTQGAGFELTLVFFHAKGD